MPAGANGTGERTVALEILEITPRINRWAETRVASAPEHVGLSLRQLSALTMIEDENTTLGDVAKRLMVTPAVVTGLIDRLERRGYVRRVNSTDDRRRVMLALTAEGREAANAAQQYLVNEMSVALDKLSPEELQALDRALSILGSASKDLENAPGSKAAS